MTTSDTPDRNRGSIRSIITLPAYRPSPNPDERLIAREGERAGVDTVIEFPETAEEEENRREEDMQSLYNIRQARRREIDERAERRRQRQEARAAADWARLEQLRLDERRRARARADSAGSGSTHMPTSNTGEPTDSNISSSTLIAEHNARTASRERRVSSVSYADLGLARHDGSRIRAESIDNDNQPLLESAAGMGAGGASASNSRRSSLWNIHTNRQHSRAASAESLPYTDSEIPPSSLGRRFTPPGTSSSAGRSESFDSSHHPLAMRTPSGTDSDGSAPATSPPASGQADRPPEYEEPGQQPSEEAPPYSSPICDRGEGSGETFTEVDLASPQARTAAPQLSSLNVFPSIEITDSTPINTRPNSQWSR